MSIVYAVTLRNNRLQQVINAIDGGAGNGKIQIGTAGMGIVLSTVTLLKPVATIAAGVLTFSGTPLSDPGAAASGVAAEGRITDSTGTVWVSGLSVGTSGTDIIISLVNITAGSIVTFQSGTIVGN